MGDVSSNMVRVISLISSRVGHIVSLSKIYESKSWGFESSDIFQNQAIVVTTDLDPYGVLCATQSIEREFGKRVGEVEFSVDGERIYHSREMDIDIMFYDEVILDSDTLTIPHSKLHLRTFVLKPLSEVIGEFVHPKLGVTINNIKDIYESQDL